MHRLPLVRAVGVRLRRDGEEEGEAEEEGERRDRAEGGGWRLLAAAGVLRGARGDLLAIP
ncbi:hypothetical protein GCM10010211_11430 [Streptomyces albospinus]|uniref:Uncharacterized protein n=1 Tax=Streptomyces albospinus TaxID=285515 RepID=A0ABQ2USC3_9ACTN|nr:hypothetical protein [Streptomyces albospinus]GGU48857.1 hypothetical protein GCM10010211_11430 [Streptomyces albospinus]